MSETVRGYCPECGGSSLFLGSGGYITCSRGDCPNPSAASDILLDSEVEHVVTISKDTFTLRHPLRERLDGGLFRCDIHARISDMDGPPRTPGRYRIYDLSDRWEWEPIR